MKAFTPMSPGGSLSRRKLIDVGSWSETSLNLAPVSPLLVSFTVLTTPKDLACQRRKLCDTERVSKTR